MAAEDGEIELFVGAEGWGDWGVLVLILVLLLFGEVVGIVGFVV